MRDDSEDGLDGGSGGAVNCGAAVFSPTNLNQHQNGAGLEFHHMEWV